MKSLEPNLLLAITTLTALILLIASASLFGEQGEMLKYIILAAVCIPAQLLCNGWLARRSGRVTPPMISREMPATVVWAMVTPSLVMACALVPVLFSGHDYGLLVIIGAVLTGVTIESALKAAKRG